MKQEKNIIGKKIGIDGRCLLDKNYTGVSEYTVALIRKLLQEHPENEYYIFINGFRGRDIEQKISWLRKYPNLHIKHFHFPNKILNFSLWLLKYPKLDKLLGNVDIFIAPNISFLAVSKQTKFILTIHDLSFERFPETFSPKRRFWHFIINARRLCYQANQIWTVSYSTKWDLESLYKIPGDKIIVRPILRSLQKFKDTKLVTSQAQNDISEKYNLPSKFILYLGTIEPRKNIITLVQAFEYLRQHDKINKDYKLVIAGQLGWRYQHILNYIKKSKFIDDILLTDFVTPAEKVFFYKKARVFVYPSLFEGFGIPVAEAMASGTPVITSNNSSLPEVVGDAGILIDPDRVEDLIDALELMLNNQSLQTEYIKQGYNRIKKIENNLSQNKITLTS